MILGVAIRREERVRERKNAEARQIEYNFSGIFFWVK